MLVLMALLPYGCGQGPGRSAAPSAPASEPAATGVNEAAEMLKGINESIKSEAPLGPGVNMGVTQVGSHRLKTVMDVPSSATIQDESGTISFGQRKVAIDFAKGHVVVDGTRTAGLPVGTKEVEVRFVGGELSLKADGKAVTFPGESK
jgi:hypothetical protein